jgi:hypothetical protein
MIIDTTPARKASGPLPAAPPSARVGILTDESDHIPLDPTVRLPPEEAQRVRVELRDQVRAAGARWHAVIERHLRRYGAYRDPHEIERQRAEADRLAVEDERAAAERRLDAEPLTRGEFRAALAPIGEDIAALAAAVAALEVRR